MTDPLLPILTGPIVAGVDGSASSMQAAAWAAREAALRGTRLSLLHAALRWDDHLPFGPQPRAWDAELDLAARSLLARAAERAREQAPGVEIDSEIRDGGPQDVLTGASQDAQLIVVGNRGRGSLGELLLGSVGKHLTAHAACPVVIVRGDRHRSGQIVVGVTGRSDQDAVLDFAFREADRRKAKLLAVHAEESPREPAGLPSAWRSRYPGVDLVEEAPHGHAGEALVRASAAADLVVIGVRSGLHVALSPGSTVRAVTHHCLAPVAVVRH